MDAGLKIVRKPYEEPYQINLIVTASNGRSTGEIEIYMNASDLDDYGRALQDFPQSTTHSVLWELGSERPEDRFGFYFRLKFLVTRSTGQCAIIVRFNNNEQIPDTEIAEFCIPALPAQLNQLGEQLVKFAKLEDEELVWLA
jgi:hypothetical protein